MTHISPIRLFTRRFVVAAVATAAMMVAAVAGGAPAQAQDAGDPALKQTVSADEKVVPEGNPVVIDSGHIDIGPLIVDGDLQLLFRDDTVTPPVWRHFSDAVFVLGDSALQTIPEAGNDYAFTGAKPGQQVWAVPQNQIAGVPWLGWSTQSPTVTEQFVRGMTFTFGPHSGDGEVSMFVQSGGFGGPQKLFSTLDGDTASIFVEMHTHSHLNWVFTEPGIHTMVVTATGETPAGDATSARSTITFAVGDADISAAKDTSARTATDAVTGSAADTAGSEAQEETTTDTPAETKTDNPDQPAATTEDSAAADTPSQPAATTEPVAQDVADGGNNRGMLIALGVVMLLLAGVLVGGALAIRAKINRRAGLNQTGGQES
ncbi:choice-of-anchor M domain-containing protein [Corynebacterium mendelii]|uniref:choice-of-anchor M domain-containing protein n=1 Tax=Corynebacterium mendelii TaxID=2765362 RepID=UPI00366D31A3